MEILSLVITMLILCSVFIIINYNINRIKGELIQLDRAVKQIEDKVGKSHDKLVFANTKLCNLITYNENDKETIIKQLTELHLKADINTSKLRNLVTYTEQNKEIVQASIVELHNHIEHSKDFIINNLDTNIKAVNNSEDVVAKFDEIKYLIRNIDDMYIVIDKMYNAETYAKPNVVGKYLTEETGKSIILNLQALQTGFNVYKVNQDNVVKTLNEALDKSRLILNDNKNHYKEIKETITKTSNSLENLARIVDTKLTFKRPKSAKKPAGEDKK